MHIITDRVCEVQMLSLVKGFYCKYATVRTDLIEFKNTFCKQSCSLSLLMFRPFFPGVNSFMQFFQSECVFAACCCHPFWGKLKQKWLDFARHAPLNVISLGRMLVSQHSDSNWYIIQYVVQYYTYSYVDEALVTSTWVCESVRQAETRWDRQPTENHSSNFRLINANHYI